MSENGTNGRKPKRSYSEADKATTLALLEANGGNVLRTHRETDIPAATISKWRDGLSINNDILDKCDEKKEGLGLLFEQVARLYLSQAMSAEVVSAVKGKDAVIAAATALDKVQLLKGEPTGITRDVTKYSHRDRVTRILELVKPGETKAA